LFKIDSNIVYLLLAAVTTRNKSEIKIERCKVTFHRNISSAISTSSTYYMLITVLLSVITEKHVGTTNGTVFDTDIDWRIDHHVIS